MPSCASPILSITTLYYKLVPVISYPFDIPLPFPLPFFPSASLLIPQSRSPSRSLLGNDVLYQAFYLGTPNPTHLGSFNRTKRSHHVSKVDKQPRPSNRLDDAN